MKKIFFYMVSASLLMTTGGCKKFLDQQPISDLSQERFWKTAEDAALGNAAIYDGVQKALNGNYTDWGDARSDNFTFGGTGENQVNVTLNGLTSLNAAARWDNLYLTIGRANAAIENLPKMNVLTDAARNNYLAQAYGIRAYMYFTAVRVWGDMPVRLVTYKGIDESPLSPRSPKDSIIDHVIIPDLLKAYDLVDKNVTTVWDLTAGGILSILTDVYMWKKDYPKVIETTDKLIALPYKYDVNLTNAADYKKMFVEPSGTKEAIWTLNWIALQDGGNGISRIGSGSNTSNYYIDSSVLLRLEANKSDIRRSIMYDTLVVNASERVTQITKFYPVLLNTTTGRMQLPANGFNEAKLPLYRMAGMLLLRAEALNKSSADKTPVFTIVNKIRTARKATPLVAANFPTEADVEKAILDERQLELFGEGQRWYDLVRTGRVGQVMDPILRNRQRQLNLSQSGWDDDRKVLWPVSRDALNRNTLLKQNPPYSD